MNPKRRCNIKLRIFVFLAVLITSFSLKAQQLPPPYLSHLSSNDGSKAALQISTNGFPDLSGGQQYWQVYIHTATDSFSLHDTFSVSKPSVFNDTVQGLNPLTLYWFKVRLLLNKASSIDSSAFSNIDTGTTSAALVKVIAPSVSWYYDTLLNAFRIDAIDSSTIEKGFRLYISTSGGPFQLIKDTASHSPSKIGDTISIYPPNLKDNASIDARVVAYSTNDSAYREVSFFTINIPAAAKQMTTLYPNKRLGIFKGFFRPRQDPYLGNVLFMFLSGDTIITRMFGTSDSASVLLNVSDPQNISNVTTIKVPQFTSFYQGYTIPVAVPGMLYETENGFLDCYHFINGDFQQFDSISTQAGGIDSLPFTVSAATDSSLAVDYSNGTLHWENVLDLPSMAMRVSSPVFKGDYSYQIGMVGGAPNYRAIFSGNLFAELRKDYGNTLESVILCAADLSQSKDTSSLFYKSVGGWTGGYVGPNGWVEGTWPEKRRQELLFQQRCTPPRPFIGSNLMLDTSGFPGAKYQVDLKKKIAYFLFSDSLVVYSLDTISASVHNSQKPPQIESVICISGHNRILTFSNISGRNTTIEMFDVSGHVLSRCSSLHGRVIIDCSSLATKTVLWRTSGTTMAQTGRVVIR